MLCLVWPVCSARHMGARLWNSPLVILWDLDGTLADSESQHEQAIGAVLAARGIKEGRGEDLIGLSRTSVYQLLRLKHGEAMPAFADYAADVDRCFVDLSGQIGFFPEAQELFRRFASEGRRQIVVSNSVSIQVRAIIDALGIGKDLAGIIANDDKGKPKPHPEPYLRALALLGLGPEQAVTYEDSVAGTTSARAAGLFVIGIARMAKKLGAQVEYPSVPLDDPEDIIAGIVDSETIAS